jgi:hypothetical protein
VGLYICTITVHRDVAQASSKLGEACFVSNEIFLLDFNSYFVINIPAAPKKTDMSGTFGHYVLF